MPNFFSLTDLGLTASTSQALQFWLTQMQLAFPGYNPSQASLEYVHAQIMAALASDLAVQCSNGATELFRTFGTQLVGVPYQNGVNATAVISVTAQTAPNSIAVTSSPLTTGSPIVSIPVVALAYGIAPGTITLTDPTLVNTQNWTTPGANPGDTQISVTSQTPNFAYPSGSSISGTQVYSIPALSQFTLDQFGFQNLSSYSIFSGTSQQVNLTAVQAGTIFNGAGSGGNIQSVQQLVWVTSTSLVSAAANGQDPEDDQHYLSRLATQLQLQAPRPVTATDYGVMALNFNPYPGTDQQEVGRAVALDGYDPALQTFNNAREVTVAVTDANGFALNSDTLYGYPNGAANNVIMTNPTPNAGWGIAGWLQSLREITFIVNVINPTYSAIYVTVSVVSLSGWDSVSVQQNVQSALLSFLTPAQWGLTLSGYPGWVNTTVLRTSEMMTIVQQAPGVAYIQPGTLAFGLSASPTNTTDLTLPGAIPLVTSSTTTIPLTGISVS